MNTFPMEGVAAVQKAIRDMAGVREGESVLVLGDSDTDDALLQLFSSVALASGADVTQLVYSARPRPDVPPPQYVRKIMQSLDVLFDLTFNHFAHTEEYAEVVNSGVRTLGLFQLSLSDVVRLIGQTDVHAMRELGDRLAAAASRTKEVVISTPSGTELTMTNVPNRNVLHNSGFLDGAGDLSMLPGQVTWAPLEESLNGMLVLDSFVNPPASLSQLKAPIELTIENGSIVKISGGQEAEYLRGWLAGFADQGVYRVNHLGFGIHPNARRTGQSLLELERLYGQFQVGFGGLPTGFRVGGESSPAAVHVDCGSLQSTAWFDGQVICRNGRFVGSDLQDLDEKLADSRQSGRVGG